MADNKIMLMLAKFLGRDKFYRSWSAGCLNFNPDDDQWRYILTKGLEPQEMCYGQ